VARLRAFSGPDLCLALAAEGFVEVRCRGRHIVMQKRVAGSTITLSVPTDDRLTTDTLLSLIHQSGLPRALFEE
jgi:predicted RNA binding protein YcfA (HicA-like mRNA interferase family)